MNNVHIRQLYTVGITRCRVGIEYKFLARFNREFVFGFKVADTMFRALQVGQNRNRIACAGGNFTNSVNFLTLDIATVMAEVQTAYVYAGFNHFFQDFFGTAFRTNRGSDFGKFFHRSILAC